jgi:hypothetical protein
MLQHLVCEEEGNDEREPPNAHADARTRSHAAACAVRAHLPPKEPPHDDIWYVMRATDTAAPTVGAQRLFFFSRAMLACFCWMLALLAGASGSNTGGLSPACGGGSLAFAPFAAPLVLRRASTPSKNKGEVWARKTRAPPPVGALPGAWGGRHGDGMVARARVGASSADELRGQEQERVFRAGGGKGGTGAGGSGEAVKIVSYNVLGPKQALTDKHAYSNFKWRKWPYRKDRILDELRAYDADVVCLQEVTPDTFVNDFAPALKELGLDKGIYTPKRLPDGEKTSRGPFRRPSKGIEFSKVLCIVTLCSKCSRILTVENLCVFPASLQRPAPGPRAVWHRHTHVPRYSDIHPIVPADPARQRACSPALQTAHAHRASDERQRHRHAPARGASH